MKDVDSKEISKIKINDQEYQVKDAEFRKNLAILLGKMPSKNEENIELKKN